MSSLAVESKSIIEQSTIQTRSPLTETAEKVASRRYYRRDATGKPTEDWNGLAWRVVNHVCAEEDEAFRTEMHELIYSTKFLPNSPCLVNSGTTVGGLLACFVTKSPEDSWTGMMENITNFGHIARRGGGCGVDFSQIRPTGDPVFGSTHAKACGPIKHMIVVSEAMNSITQAGFRGMANMGVLRVDHPDITTFIHCKQRKFALKYILKEDIGLHFQQFTDEYGNPAVGHEANVFLDKFISNFNISVLITNEFMKAVEANADFTLSFNGRSYRSVNARKLFDEIAENAWKNGDPGLLFFDAINNGPYKYSGQTITASNPCITGDSIVLTDDGPKPIKDMVGKKHRVLSYHNGGFVWTTTAGAFKTKTNASVIRIQTATSEIVCTPDHPILTPGGFVKGNELTPGQMIVSNPYGLEVSHGLEHSSGEKWTDLGAEIQKVSACLEKVVQVTEESQTRDVYDLTTDHDSHNFIANGLVVHNCGEQVLPQYGSCNLGSIDVNKFYEPTTGINWKRLRRAIELSVQFLDNVIDANEFPTEHFHQWAQDNRPVGLGIMGFADLLLAMKIRYGSKESLELAEHLGSFFAKVAHDKSVELGKLRGTPKCCQYEELEYRRNVTTISIAPTGSISILAGCSSSIEPIFAPIIYRSDTTGQYTMPHPLSSEPYFTCALDPQNPDREVTWKEHLAIQATFQKHVNSGISKTINMRNDATVEDVKEAYMLAWKSGCKGITIYRDGSKTTQVLNTEDKRDPTRPVKRPKEVKCDVHHTKANGKDWHIIVGKIDDRPYEVFAVNGRIELPEYGKVVKRKKQHYSLVDVNDNVLIDNLNDEEELIDQRLGCETRRFSLELRHNIPVKFIVQQIDKSSEALTSFSKAVSRILRTKYLSEDEYRSIASKNCPEFDRDKRECKIIYESGCWRCTTHDYAKCG